MGMAKITVTTPDGVTHDYIANELACIAFARDHAHRNPGRDVRIVGAAEDGSAINATLTWTAADGIVHRNHLPVLARR
jgi:hypothetical protein